MSSAVAVSVKATLELLLFLGGRSMSSQLVPLAVAEDTVSEVHGVALFAFPMRWRQLLSDPVAHLTKVHVPMLFVQGTRDELADLGELRLILERLGERVSLQVVDGADHLYCPPENSGRPHSNHGFLPALHTSASVPFSRLVRP